MTPPFRSLVPLHRLGCLVWMLLLSAAPGMRAADGDGVRKLFDGRSTQGWRAPAEAWKAVGGIGLDPANAKQFKLEEGEGILVNGNEGRTSNLVTEMEHGDAEVHIEFMVPAGSNSGVYFQGRYEIQILDSFGKETLASGDCGGIYASCSGEPKCFEGVAPPVNVSRRPGEWQSFDVVFRAPRFDADGRKLEPARFVQVKHNGRVIHQEVEVTCPTCASSFADERPTGPLMLQGDHGPVAYRNLTIKPIHLR